MIETRQMSRKAARAEAKAKTRKPQDVFDPQATQTAFARKLRGMDLQLLGRHYHRVREEAKLVNIRLAIYQNEHGGQLPLLSSPLAPLAYALGLKYYDVCRELIRRGHLSNTRPDLGGVAFQAMFKEVVAVQERPVKLAESDTFVDRLVSGVMNLFRVGRSTSQAKNLTA
jgi:hypothetical protein